MFMMGANFCLDFVRFYLNCPSTIAGVIYTLLCNEVDNIDLKKNSNILYGAKLIFLELGLMNWIPHYHEQEVFLTYIISLLTIFRFLKDLTSLI